MPKHAGKKHRHVTLDAFIRVSSKPSGNEESESHVDRNAHVVADHDRREPEDVSTIVDEVLSFIGKEQLVGEHDSSLNTLKRGGAEKPPTEIILAKTRIPTGKVLDAILEEGIGSMDVTCRSDGLCTDGRRVGEIFKDRFGFERQRGFVRTTRIPVYTDWILEESIVTPLLPRAHKLVTSRGAVAIVPDDYLCELQERYGIILKNYDKCRKPGNRGTT